MNTSKHDIFWTFVFLLFAFILQVAITSKLSYVIKDVSILADFLSFTQILMIISAYASLGYDLSVDKYVKWFIQKQKFNTLNSYINLYVNIIFKTTILVLVVICMHYALTRSSPWLYQHLNGINFFYCNFVFIGIIVIIVNIIYFTGRVIRCYLGSKYYVLIAQLLPFLFIYVGLFSIENMLYKCNLYLLAFIYIASFSLAAVIALTVMQRTNKKKIKIKLEPFNFKINNFVKIGFAFAKSDISAYTRYFIIPIAEIRSYISGSISTAFVSVSIVLNIFIEILIRTISAIIKPNIFMAYKAGREEFIRNINRLTLLIVFIGIAYLFVVVSLGKNILAHLYGDQLVAGYSIYLMISVGAVFDLMSIPYRLSLEIISTRLAAKISLRVGFISIVALLLSSVFGTHSVCFVYVLTRIGYTLTLYTCFKYKMSKQIYSIYMS